VVVLRKHFDLLYWWVVWLYAAFAAGMTYTFGETVTINGKGVKMYSEPWLAIGFLAVVLFVAIFTSVRARGAMSMILVFFIVGIAVAIHFANGWKSIFDWFPMLRLHINMGFYVAVFAILFPVWLLTTFFFNRLHYYRFKPGRQVSSVKMIGGGETNIAAHTFVTHKLDDDIFVHRVLGLWPLFGTGDIEISYARPDGSVHREVLENVINASSKLSKINDLLGSGHR
jgi:MFS family permease